MQESTAVNEGTVPAPSVAWGHGAGAAVLWHAHGTRLGRFIRRRVDDDMAAEDILQDVFLRAQQKLPGLQRPERVQAWLYRIARNALVDHYRARETIEPVPQWLEQEEPDSRENVLREMAECLIPMIDRLPTPYRDALRLAELEGMKQKDVARLQGLSLSGAKSRIQRGRAMLRRMFTDCCHVQRDAGGRIANCEPRTG
jgi:RNA polymerase sigma-70 factor, ECF subfamily